jgi:hypothetical protein
MRQGIPGTHSVTHHKSAHCTIQQLADKSTLQMICHQGFFVWSADQADMSAAARQFCREVLENCHEPKAVEAWLRRRAGKKLRNRWEAMDPKTRCVIMETNPDRTFPLCSAPTGIFDSRHDRQRYPHREGRVETPTVVEAPLPLSPTVVSSKEVVVVNNLILHADKLRDSMARDILTTELTYLAYWAREKNVVMVAKKAAVVVDCLAARLGTLVGPARRDEVLLCCKDIAAHIAAAPTMMAMSSDEEIVGDLEECRNVRLQSEMAARQFMVVTTQANECFKRVYETRTTFKPTHSNRLQHFNWLVPPLESAPGSLDGDEGDSCGVEGEESSDNRGDSGEEGSDSGEEGDDSGEEGDDSEEGCVPDSGDSGKEGGDSGKEGGHSGGGDSGGNCLSGTDGADRVEQPKVLRQNISNPAEHVKKRPRACVTQRSNKGYYMG